MVEGGSESSHDGNLVKLEVVDDRIVPINLHLLIWVICMDLRAINPPNRQNDVHAFALQTVWPSPCDVRIREASMDSGDRFAEPLRSNRQSSMLWTLIFLDVDLLRLASCVKAENLPPRSVWILRRFRALLTILPAASPVATNRTVQNLPLEELSAPPSSRHWSSEKVPRSQSRWMVAKRAAFGSSFELKHTEVRSSVIRRVWNCTIVDLRCN